MLSCLLAYNAGGEVVASLDHLIWLAPDGTRHVVDFAAHEAAGGKLRNVWLVNDAVGSGSWPEWLGASVHDFRVELDHGEAHRIRRLVHQRSGHVRHRDRIDREIARRHAAEVKAIRKTLGLRKDAEVSVDGVVVDLRDLLGGPGKPLEIDDDGRNTKRHTDAEWTAPFPLIRHTSGRSAR